MYMRTMGCPLEGHHLEAENDEELFKVTSKHAEEVYPEQGFTDERLRSIIEERTFTRSREPVSGQGLLRAPAYFMPLFTRVRGR
jgi:hypothetical protein